MSWQTSLEAQENTGNLQYSMPEINIINVHSLSCTRSKCSCTCRGYTDLRAWILASSGSINATDITQTCNFHWIITSLNSEDFHLMLIKPDRQIWSKFQPFQSISFWMFVLWFQQKHSSLLLRFLFLIREIYC